MTEQEIYQACRGNMDVLSKLFIKGIVEEKEQSSVLYAVYESMPDAEKAGCNASNVVATICKYLDAYLGVQWQHPDYARVAPAVSPMTEQELYKACMGDADLQARLLARGLFETKEQSAVLYATYESIPDGEKANCQRGDAAATLIKYIDAYLGSYKQSKPIQVAHAVNTPKDRMYDAYEFVASNEFTSKLENSGITSEQERFQIVGCVLTFTQSHGYGQSEGLPKLKKVLYDWLDRKPMNRVDLWVWLLANFYDASKLKSIILDE